jgi:hypothetical protein
LGYVDPRGTDSFGYLILDLARYLLWALMGGLITAGACWYGGYAAHRSYQAWQDSHPRGRRYWHTSTSHEAARGIGEIEAYLATCPQLAAPPVPPAPPAGSTKPAQQQPGDPAAWRPEAHE